LLRIKFRFSFSEDCLFLGNDDLDELFHINPVIVFICGQDKLETAFYEFGIDVYALEVLHVFFVKVFPCLYVRQNSI
jgi:hypothetical protein